MPHLKSTDARRLALVSALLLVALAAFVETNAQSGRRNPAKTPLPTPTPAPVPSATTPTPARTPEPKPEPQFVLRVLSSVPQLSRFYFPLPDRMQHWVAERLRSSLLVEVGTGSNTASVNDARQLAKNSEALHVVFVEFDEDPFGNPGARRSRLDRNDLWINYTVFAPGTGKAGQRGRAYIKPELLGRNRRVIGQETLCYPAMTDEEYLLLQASYETAERILAGFDLPIPPLKCGPSV